MKNTIHKGSLFLTMLTSGSTLICCAIPAILVVLGAGSVVAALVGTFPQLVWLSEHKIWLFGFGGLMLGLSRYFSIRSQNSCPIDPALADQCKKTKQWTTILWWVSAVIYVIGFCVSYLIPLFLPLLVSR